MQTRGRRRRAGALSSEAPVALVGVYRSRNGELVRRLAEAARSHGIAVAWWALDDVAPELAAETVGAGPGTKFPLLNELLDRIDTPRDSWLVVSDDDVAFDRGDIGEFVSLSRRASLDLAQPARSEHVVDHEITRRRKLSLARLTSFVEIGPLFVVGPRWRDRIVPFPPEREMGWGLELDWLDLHREGCHLGIVDAVSVHHEGVRAGEYDFDRHHEVLFDELARRGVGHWRDVQETLGVWRPWRRRPPWMPGTPQ